MLQNSKIYLAKFLGFYGGCLACCYLQRQFDCSPVLSSTLVGFLGSFYHFESRIEKSGIHAVIYAGSFAGMCSFENLPGPIEIFYISLIGTFFYFWLKPHFTGFGGKLGVIALLSSVVVVFSRGLW